ncbi:ABC transporter substrate-binding protein [Streptomyces aidingensis]|uniref:ABC-type branched-chain amino acid transport system, substrate-binding protein n=1 Tax=Streptomyces aidingensis TaxID=910347 RepID=A0A1I1HWK1_9ACTN|nr:ABC transporter substrate-binding protein [Streptomyces aidingensis]SFC25350.1 ABC-type branched-chain amino acid transport system, substrate-binding protein [Streptomyces aidingensis]
MNTPSRLPGLRQGLRQGLRHRWFRLGRGVQTLLLAGLVLAVAVILLVLVDRLTDDSCAPGVVERDGECVGVTDGSFVFSPHLERVSARIERENDEVRASGQEYVTVALMIPMTLSGEVGREQILKEVQGAFLAQYRANHQDNDAGPLIRLVLANPGRDSAHWERVTEQLIGMAADDSDRLRAVTGFNISQRPAGDILTRLTGAGVPVVAGPLTADNLGNTAEDPEAFPGMVKIVPDNGDQAAALASFQQAAEGEGDGEPLLVYDARAGDHYNSTLYEIFGGELAGAAAYEPMKFTSSGITDTTGVAAQFRLMIPRICNLPDTVNTLYFAGRPTHLRQFVNELGEQPCRRFTVISASGASTLATDTELNWDVLGKGITVRYSALAHPDAWPATADPVGGEHDAMETLKTLAAEHAARIGTTDLEDSRAIVMYDAVWTAVEGIRLAAAAGAVAVPSAAEVAAVWAQMSQGYGVSGASGWICLNNHGNAHNKAVAVVSLDPDNPGRLRFDGLAWPQGAPPGTDCTIPNRAAAS